MLTTTTSGVGYHTSTMKGRFHTGRPSKRKLNTETLATTKVLKDGYYTRGITSSKVRLHEWLCTKDNKLH